METGTKRTPVVKIKPTTASPKHLFIVLKPLTNNRTKPN